MKVFTVPELIPAKMPGRPEGEEGWPYPRVAWTIDLFAAMARQELLHNVEGGAKRA